MTQIRQATSNDVPVLLPLVEGYWRFQGVPGFDSERVAAQLSQLLSEPRLGCGWIALLNNIAVGYLLAVFVFSLEHMGLTAEIDEFYVVPQARGRGLGRSLLGAAEALCLRTGCTNVSLQLGRDNHAARAFYRRHGFSERSGYELLDKILHHD